MNVTVKLKGSLNDEYGNFTPIHMTTVGVFKARKEMYWLKYLETEEAGLGDEVYTTVLIKSGHVVMIRGARDAETRIDFIQGKTHYSYYETPFGSFKVSVATHLVDIDVTERGGRIRLGYEINMMGGSNGRNDLTIEITPDE